MKEIRVGDKDLIVKNNIVNSPVIPETSAEMKRRIIVEGEAEFTGPVYGESVLIHNGPVTFRKAIFGRSEVNVDIRCEGKIVFSEAVGTAESVSCARMEKTIFCSDINAKKIVLKNCFVGGSLYAEDISLDSCVVIGGVFATKSMNANHCLLGTFNAQSAALSGENYLLYPSAFSVEPMSTASNTTLFNISLADLMGLYKGEKPKEHTGSIRMDLKNDRQKTSLKAEDGTLLMVNSYSVAGRVLIYDLKDFENLNNHFLINGASLYSQLLKEYTVKNNETGEEIPLEIERIANFFFDILSGKIEIAEIDGSISFDTLKQQFEES